MSIIVDNISYTYEIGTGFEKQALKNVKCVINDGDFIGRTYRFFQYYGAKNPKYVVIAMGSVCETIREILPQMNCADTDCNTGSSGM